MEDKEVKAVHIVSIIFKRRWLIIGNFLIVAFVSAIISLSLPKWYIGRTIILPPSGNTGIGMATFSQSSLGNVLGGMTNVPSMEVGIYLAILNSRTLKQAAIDSFDLARELNFKGDYYIENVLRVLAERVSVKLDEEMGTISISVLDKKPKLAADLANFFVWKLDKINKKLSVEQAQRERIFLEERLKLNYDDIAQAEKALKDFQEKYSAVAIPEQVAAAITTAAEIKAELISYQVQYEIAKGNMDADHPTLKDLELQIKELQRRLSDFNVASAEFGEGKGLFPGFSEIPALQLEYAELIREVEVQNNLLEFLYPQYEAAKIQEAKDTPTIQVLDYAVPAEKKTKPKRANIVIFSCLFATIISLIYIFVLEYFNNIRLVKKNEYKTWQTMVDSIKNDISRLPLLGPFMRKRRK